MNIGFTIGKFAPFHKGHEYLIKKGIEKTDEFYILINETDVTDMPIETRAMWIKNRFPQAHVILGKNPPKQYGMDNESIKIQTDYLKSVFKDIPVTVFYSSEDYGKYVAKAFNIENVRVRKEIDINATKIRENIENSKEYLEDYVYEDLKKYKNKEKPNMGENILKTLDSRGYIEQVTDKEELTKLLEGSNVPFYIGIDPTADSLHVGHFVSLMVSSYMQKAGHKPIILVGGGTANIGDPSGKTDMRKMLSKEDIDNNVKAIKEQVAKFVSFEGENAAIIVNNADWLCDLKFIDFMKEIGSQFSINKMLAAECYKNRLETGLTFFEMGYMLMQSYDFLHLYNKYGCKLEIGGNDQWSNIIGGVNLVRKLGHDDSFGLTFRLLTTKEGKKMGKTEKGALWLNKDKTSPYEFYQYWRNVDDKDVRTVLCMLTFLSMDEIGKLTNVEGEAINEAKRVAAYEITKLIHGEEEAKKAEEAANALFTGKGNTSNMPTAEIDVDTTILDAIIASGFAPSKGQARTLIMQGGIMLGDEKVSDTNYKITEEMLSNELILKKGKKGFCKLVKK